jgi:hypothetical protein
LFKFVGWAGGALPRLGIKLRYVPAALPKLKALIANELPCGFDGRFVVGAVQIDCPDEWPSLPIT